MPYFWQWCTKLLNIDWDANSVTAASTVVLAVITTILAFGTVGLWCATRRLVKGGEETARRQLRAYVCIEIFPDDHPIVSFDGPIVVILRIVNRGVTPAYGVEQTVIIGVVKLPPPAKIKIPTTDLLANPITLGPNANVIVNAIIPNGVKDEERKLLLAGTHVFHVAGTVSYLDAFGEHRVTNYNMIMPIGPDGNPFGIQSCEQGNEST